MHFAAASATFVAFACTAALAAPLDATVTSVYARRDLPSPIHVRDTFVTLHARMNHGQQPPVQASQIKGLARGDAAPRPVSAVPPYPPPPSPPAPPVQAAPRPPTRASQIKGLTRSNTIPRPNGSQG
ncbi:hypothetical protein EIP91_002467 [Steccherinum ochraceum]|uniref:Uncharacterized protein n=1 Tax=Steccherinum ochraceum TaxID=92696 RepID=A0A4R0RFS4_9APHY|nr:hypothetical protein EIP91_002467 [Steccherinum ochraceum]